MVSAATSARPFVGEILVFLLFRGKLIKHANHRMRQDAVDARTEFEILGRSLKRVKLVAPDFGLSSDSSQRACAKCTIN